jgi:hypothetical protein
MWLKTALAKGGKTKTGLFVSCHFRVMNLLIGENILIESNSIMQITLVKAEVKVEGSVNGLVV